MTSFMCNPHAWRHMWVGCTDDVICVYAARMTSFVCRQHSWRHLSAGPTDDVTEVLIPRKTSLKCRSHGWHHWSINHRVFLVFLSRKLLHLGPKMKTNDIQHTTKCISEKLWCKFPTLFLIFLNKNKTGSIECGALLFHTASVTASKNSHKL